MTTSGSGLAGHHGFPIPGHPGRGLAIAFGTALVLHSAIALSFVLMTPAPKLAPEGQQAITIDLAPNMADAAAASVVATAATQEAAQQQAAEDTAAAPPPAEPETSQDIAEAPPEEAPLLMAEAERLAVEKIIDSTTVEAPEALAHELLPPPRLPEPAPAPVRRAEVKPEPAPKPRPKPVEKRKPDPKKLVQKPREVKEAARPRAAAQASPSARSAPSQASAASHNSPGGAAASADPNALSRYAAQLAAALRSRLRFPPEARGAGSRHIAVLRFSMNRNGRVMSSSIVRSAGHPALDRAALATAAPGSSLPAAPASLPQQVITVSVPLRFDAY